MADHSSVLSGLHFPRAGSSYDAPTDGMICIAASFLSIVLPRDMEEARLGNGIG